MSNEPLSTLSHISGLVQATLDQIDDPRVPTSAIARRSLRIARLRNDWEGQWWLQLEMTTPALSDGVTKDLLVAEAKRISTEVAAHLTAEEYQAVGERVARRWLGARATDKGFQVQSVADLEELASGIEAQIGTFATVPAGMDPADLYRRHSQLMEASAQLRVAVTEAKQLLARIRTRIGDYLSVTERQLLFGQVNADAFERNRKWVDERLARDAPQILEQFAAAYRRQAEGDAESRSHALMSCRRVLKTLADLLYPADGEVVRGVDDRERKMTDDKYLARLCQFATVKAAGSASREVLIAQIKALGERLDALNDLSSKGVHAQVSAAEVDQCLIQTYLAVGDLLRLADADSGALAA